MGLGLLAGIFSALSAGANIYGTIRNASKNVSVAGMGEAMSSIGGQLANVQDAFEDPIDKAKEEGRAQRAYLDEAFPGTNPWERTGASAGGVTAAVSERQRKQDLKIQEKALDVQLKAAVLPPLLKDNPKLHGKALDELGMGHLATPNMAAESISSRKVSVDEMNAETNKIMKDIARDRLNFDKAVFEWTRIVDDRTLVTNALKVLVDMRKDDLSGWMKALRMLGAGAEDLVGGESYSRQLRKQLEAIVAGEKAPGMKARPAKPDTSSFEHQLYN